MTQNERDVWTVAAVNRYIREYLEQDETLSSLWVRGELSNFKHHASGHMYFTLKDESSRIDAVMFARYNRRLKFLPKDGDSVLVRCSVSMYEIGGKVQLYVKEMQPDGIGGLFLAFEQLKEKLEAEGLFRAEVKRTLPKYPRTVGVITSPSGAAVRDIVTTISRRAPFVHIVIIPVVVQGEEAPHSIIHAIKHANEQFSDEIDVLIVGRGGGSLEELWAFNEEIVARAIYQSEIPIISAVGHETDVTIADFVADVRAATPTAAAELAVPDIQELASRLDRIHSRLTIGFKRIIREQRLKLQRFEQSSALRRPLMRVYDLNQRLDKLDHALKRAMKNLVEQRKLEVRAICSRVRTDMIMNRVTTLKQQYRLTKQSLNSATEKYYGERRNLLRQYVRQLDALSPLKVLQRGYSLVYEEKSNRLVKNVSDVQLGDIVHVHLSDGRLDCQVWGLEENDAHEKKTHGNDV